MIAKKKEKLLLTLLLVNQQPIQFATRILLGQTVASVGESPSLAR
jgi:hypothetical protein